MRKQPSKAKPAKLTGFNVLPHVNHSDNTAWPVMATIYVPSDPSRGCVWQCNKPVRRLTDLAELDLVVLQIVPTTSDEIMSIKRNTMPLEELDTTGKVQFKALIVADIKSFPELSFLGTDFTTVTISNTSVSSEGYHQFLGGCLNSKNLLNLRLARLTVSPTIREAICRRFAESDLASLKMMEVKDSKGFYQMCPLLMKDTIEKWVESENPILKAVDVPTEGKVELRGKTIWNLPHNIRARMLVCNDLPKRSQKASWQFTFNAEERKKF